MMLANTSLAISGLREDRSGNRTEAGETHR